MENNFVKITNTAYKILDFLPDSDPLKNKAKEKALAVLEQLTVLFAGGGWVSVKNYLSPEREKAMAQLLDDINVLENYLEIGKRQGWIDAMNFFIIYKEYEKIKSQIAVSKRTIALSAENASLPAKKEKPLMISESPRGRASADLPARQSRILEILQVKEKAQVADFIKELPKVTKRTIRRDLDDLLKHGRIIRLGQFNQVSYQLDRTR